MKRLLVFAACSLLLLSACASSKPKPGTAESKSTFKSLTVGRGTTVTGVLEPSAVFLTSDEGIVAQAEIADLHGEVEARWDWIAPGDRVYVSSSRKVASGEGMYYPKVAVSHTLNVDREEASALPGLWAVEFYADGVLKDSKKFNIEPGLSTLLSPAVAPDLKKWALVVGIERYSHLPPVEFAASDARKTANYLVNLLGVPERNVILLENDKATRSAIISRLKDYLPKNLDEGSTLYVYFAGHGMPDVATGEPFLALYDSEATNISRTGLSLKEYLGDIGALNVSRAFVFTDACFSGMAARGDRMLVSGARPAVLKVEDVSLASGKVVAIGASTGAQLSHSYKDKRQGLFTYYLLAGLRGDARGNRAGDVTVGELYGYMKENVGRVSKRTAMEQVPSVTPRLETVEAIPVSGRPARGDAKEEGR